MAPPRTTYLSLQAAADLLGVSSRTIRRRVAEGDLRAYHVGTRKRAAVRVDQAEVLALLQVIPTADPGTWKGRG